MARVPAVKRRRLSPPEENGKSNGAAVPATGAEDGVNSFYHQAANWDLEQDYEQRRRKSKKEEKSAKLPIKTAEGWVEQEPEMVPEPAKEESDEDSFLGSGDEEEVEEEEEEAVPEIPAREQIISAKEELARIASLISENPEDNIGKLKGMAELAQSRNFTVRKLALATQLAVYKDVIPGYRIRPASEEEMKAKLSKEVRALRDFEQALVHGYKGYVKYLGKAAKKSPPNPGSEQERGLATVAISCACNLLSSVPHFNFRGDILNILVGKLSTRHVDADFAKCREALEKLFQEDEDGNASLEAVGMLTKMMKSKSYWIHESVLNTFLHLRLLSEFAHKGGLNRIDKPEDEEQQNGKKPKMKREFRTKKLRKVMREQKVVDKEMQEADAVVTHEERDKNQSEQLKLVFIAYFRILKQRSPSLMGAVLEGLARYAHLINQDFFGDILEALKDLITSAEASADDDEEQDDSAPRNFSRESLLCVITAFALLEGQDAAKSASSLHLDLSFFITHLYRTLLPTALNTDIELSAKSLRLTDPTDADSKIQHKINVQTTVVLLLRSLSSVLLPPTSTRNVPPVRLAAFAKQLLTISLQLPEKSCLAMVGLLTQVVKVQGKKVAALWHTDERKGDGVFDPLRPEVESSNPFAGTVWEGELLRLHYCPKVREGIMGLEKGVLASRS